MAMVPLFTLAGRSRRHWEPPVIEAAAGKLTEALAYLEGFIGDEGYAVGRSLTQADGAIVPQLILASEWIPSVFGTPDPLLSLPRLAAYWSAVQDDPVVARIAGETRQAIAEQQEVARDRARKAV
jgi:glutathione S-transferase